jgi:methyl coenzyme M reductase subunit C-like uncharacterized protein (methanogenesis marker protein 7)
LRVPARSSAWHCSKSDLVGLRRRRLRHIAQLVDIARRVVEEAERVVFCRFLDGRRGLRLTQQGQFVVRSEFLPLPVVAADRLEPKGQLHLGHVSTALRRLATMLADELGDLVEARDAPLVLSHGLSLDR